MKKRSLDWYDNPVAKICASLSLENHHLSSVTWAPRYFSKIGHGFFYSGWTPSVDCKEGDVVRVGLNTASLDSCFTTFHSLFFPHFHYVSLKFKFTNFLANRCVQNAPIFQTGSACADDNHNSADWYYYSLKVLLLSCLKLWFGGSKILGQVYHERHDYS